MPTITLEKPANTPGQVISGTLGTDVDDKFLIKARKYRLQIWSPSAETTGDGDSAPVWENNGLIYGTFTILGAMMSDAAYGIANIITPNNPTPAVIQFNHGANRALAMQCLIDVFRLDWEATGQYVGLVISGKSSDSHPAETAAS